MELKQLPESGKSRSYNWIVVVLSILAMLGCAYGGILLHKNSDQPIIDPGAMVSEEPTPEPTAAPTPKPRPTLVPLVPVQTEAASSKAPVTYVKTSIVVDGVPVVTLSSFQAADELLRNVEYYFTTLDIIPVGSSSVLLNSVELLAAGNNAETTDYDTAFRMLTSSRTPLKFESIAFFLEDSPIAHETEIEYSDDIPEGMRIVVRYGMDGLRRKTFRATYLNGVRRELIERERVEIYPAVKGLVIVGTAQFDAESQDSPKEWPAAPLPAGMRFTTPLKGKIIKDFGLFEDGFHNGIDIEAEGGSTVLAVCDGTVVSVMERGSYGLMIEILHDGGISTRYSRLGKALVSLGTMVRAGDIIGTVADDYSVPHLHFEVRYRCASYDPKSCFEDLSILGL